MVRSTGRRLLVGAIVVLLAIGGIALAAASTHTSGYAVRTEQLWVTGTPEPGSGPYSGPVRLDSTLYLPQGAPREPAVMLAHGFGGTKADMDAEARRIAARGYVVLTWTARGFGRSGGLIHLDSPDYEVADASRLVDMLATRPEVQLDGPGDPRVAVAGASYGGALALLLAAYDHRIDAIIPQVTWNDLGHAFFPQSAVTSTTLRSPAGVDPVGTPGVFKKDWASLFFSPSGGSIEAATGQGGSAPAVGKAPPAPPGSASPPGCGRFAVALCRDYQTAAVTGRPTPAMLTLLARSSPSNVLNRISAPTLLVQGEADSLFPLSEADANARGIAAHGTPVKVVWFSGGHDGGAGTTAETQRITAATDSWLDHYLKGATTSASAGFDVTFPSTAVTNDQGQPLVQIRTAPAEPGVTGTTALRSRSVSLTGPAQTILAPAGGSPAAVTILPGLGQATSALNSVGGLGLGALPGQSAGFESAPLASSLQLVGSSRVTVHVSGTGADATLFAQLYDVGPGGSTVLPEGLTSPVYLPSLSPQGRDVTIATPAVVRDIPAGHRLRLVISTTDQAYAMPAQPSEYTVSAPSGSALRLVAPEVAMTAVGGGGVAALWPYALALLVAVAAVLAGRRRIGRGSRVATDAGDSKEFPLAVEGLGKAYGNGFRAVTDLHFRVERGWVLGLLGPNGAGKTTTLRMLMGLIHPTEGRARIFGHVVTPGAPVLSRVGAFVDGPGFLPHVSGVENLRLYWAATGRPATDARLDEALEIAGLGEDALRLVKTYSHGMRQRLGIAQAMLGLPDLLMLDEPTNGLDPPQIREMREVLARYAATGRTVLVSSHLLSEVEQTCTHVIVMHQGRLVAQGPVAEFLASATTLAVDVDDPARAFDVVSAVQGATDVELTPTGLTLRLVGTPRSELVRALVDSGLGVNQVYAQRGLEQVFLNLTQEGVH